jgi:branched-subunit amino acid transport protein
MSEAEFWPVIAAIGFGTWLIRFSFLGLLAGRTLPRVVQELLGYIPAATLAALVAPAMLVADGQIALSADNLRLFAGLAAVVIGLWSRNVLVTLIGGMLTLWLLQWALV